MSVYVLVYASRSLLKKRREKSNVTYIHKCKAPSPRRLPLSYKTTPGHLLPTKMNLRKIFVVYPRVLGVFSTTYAWPHAKLIYTTNYRSKLAIPPCNRTINKTTGSRESFEAVTRVPSSRTTDEFSTGPPRAYLARAVRLYRSRIHILRVRCRRQDGDGYACIVRGIFAKSRADGDDLSPSIFTKTRTSSQLSRPVLRAPFRKFSLFFYIHNTTSSNQNQQLCSARRDRSLVMYHGRLCVGERVRTTCDKCTLSTGKLNFLKVFLWLKKILNQKRWVQIHWTLSLRTFLSFEMLVNKIFWAKKIYMIIIK